MKKIIIIFCLLLCYELKAQPPYLQWVISAGKVSGGGAIGLSLAIDKNGNSYTTGWFSDTADFDPSSGVYNLVSQGLHDVFVVKYDSTGSLVWAVSIGSSSSDEAVSIVLDSAENVYVTGKFDLTVDFDPGPGIYNMTCGPSAENTFVLKLDSNGNFIWAKNIFGYTSLARSIEVDGAGNVYVAGVFFDTCDFDPGTSVYNLTSAGNEDIFVFKLNSIGDFQWAKQVGSTWYDTWPTIVSDSVGNVYISGRFCLTVDFDPGPATYNLSAPAIGGHFFLLKLNSGGNFVWAFTLGAGPCEEDHVLNLDNNGHVIVIGSFSGTTDFDPGSGVHNMTAGSSAFILKIDTAMNFVSVKLIEYGSSGNELYIRSANVDNEGNLYMCGSFYGTFDFDPGLTIYNLSSISSIADMFILKIDSAGAFSWIKHIYGGASGKSEAQNIEVSNVGEIYTIGEFSQLVDFDPNYGVFNVSSFSSGTIFLQKLGFVPVGISEILKVTASISLFPNPTSNNLTIETIKPTNISIVNLLGQELFNSKIEKSETIDVSFLSNGIYFVKDLNNGGSVKFVKQ